MDRWDSRGPCAAQSKPRQAAVRRSATTQEPEGNSGLCVTMLMHSDFAKRWYLYFTWRSMSLAFGLERVHDIKRATVAAAAGAGVGRGVRSGDTSRCVKSSLLHARGLSTGLHSLSENLCPSNESQRLLRLRTANAYVAGLYKVNSSMGQFSPCSVNVHIRHVLRQCLAASAPQERRRVDVERAIVQYVLPLSFSVA